ncbi:MAG: hypothetical protein LBB88_08610 [Planctomycetaceae bacterium]|nr:hypothetical protein [Planctomycetaceae bacterium]
MNINPEVEIPAFFAIIYPFLIIMLRACLRVGLLPDKIFNPYSCTSENDTELFKKCIQLVSIFAGIWGIVFFLSMTYCYYSPLFNFLHVIMNYCMMGSPCVLLLILLVCWFDELVLIKFKRKNINNTTNITNNPQHDSDNSSQNLTADKNNFHQSF